MFPGLFPGWPVSRRQVCISTLLFLKDNSTMINLLPPPIYRRVVPGTIGDSSPGPEQPRGACLLCSTDAIADAIADDSDTELA